MWLKTKAKRKDWIWITKETGNKEEVKGDKKNHCQYDKRKKNGNKKRIIKEQMWQ